MWGNANILDVLLARTTTKYGRYADKKHLQQDPKMREQVSLCLLVQRFALFVHVSVYSWIYVQAHEQTLDWLACAVAVSKRCHFVPRCRGCNPSNPKQRNDLGKTVKVNDSEFNIDSLSPLTAREKAACTVLGQPALHWVQEGCMFELESEPRVVLYRNEILHLTRSVTRF